MSVACAQARSLNKNNAINPIITFKSFDKFFRIGITSLSFYYSQHLGSEFEFLVVANIDILAITSKSRIRPFQEVLQCNILINKGDLNV